MNQGRVGRIRKLELCGISWNETRMHAVDRGILSVLKVSILLILL